jgi:hypothetical protein
MAVHRTARQRLSASRSARRYRRGVRVSLHVIVLCWLWAAVGSASAATADTGSVSMVGEQGDYISGGGSFVFDSSADSLRLTGTAAYATVSVNGASSLGDNFTFLFRPQAGAALAPGLYADAARYPLLMASRGALDVFGDGRGCTDTGTFDVRDIHADDAGNLDRLWVIYEGHCGSPGGAAHFGEVRINEPTSAVDPYAEPTTVAWPGDDIGRPTQVVPVKIFAGESGRHVSSVALGGPDAASFSIRLDQCTGASLAADAGCQVFVRFNPSVGGERMASLLVTDDDGTTVAVPLSGFGFSGVTGMDLQSDPGDFVGGGLPSSYDTSDAKITAVGTRQGLRFSVSGDDGTYMTADFVPGDGDILAAGTTYRGAAREPFNNQGTGMDVSGNGVGCNTVSGQFTVTDLNFDAAGNLQDAGVSFIQHCDKVAPALRGTFQWRAQTPADIPALNLLPPTVLGIATVGTTVQASVGTWSDPSTQYGFQWRRCTATACADIVGATAATYAVAAADVGFTLVVDVNLTNAGGPSAFVASPPTAVVAAPPVTIDPPPVSPGVGAAPSVAPVTGHGAADAPAGAGTSAAAAAATATATATATTADPRAPAAAVPPLTETISVPAHQSATAVARSGLVLTTGCSQACAVSLSVSGATASVARANTRVVLAAGHRITLHLRLHGKPAKQLLLTSTAAQLAAPHAVTLPLRKRVILR